MNLFSNLFNKKTTASNTNNFDWHPITSLTQIDTIINQSDNTPVVIFKHSTHCGISNTVIKRFENKNIEIENVAWYYLDLLTFREISNEIANKLNVIHQSPQVILLHKKQVVTHVSHYEILDLEIPVFNSLK